MGLKKLAAKLADYRERLERGKASKINPSHVKKVLEKLQKKLASLNEEVASTEKPDRKARLNRKLNITREQIKHAEWLLKEIE